MPTVLFFRPDEDLAMQYASNWLGKGVAEATSRGFRVLDMVDNATVFEQLKEIMAAEQVDIAFMGGHGNPTTFTGFNQQVVFQVCQGDEVMKDTISHFLSCSVGQQLLPDIITKGGVWTIGYQVDFEFMVDTTKPVDEDPFAEPFRDVTVTIIKTILDGKTLKEVWDAGIAKCDEWIAKLYDRPETDWAEVISCLQHDRDGMIGLGDKEAYVTPPRKVSVGAPAIVLILAFLFFGKPSP